MPLSFTIKHPTPHTLPTITNLATTFWHQLDKREQTRWEELHQNSNLSRALALLTSTRQEKTQPRGCTITINFKLIIVSIHPLRHMYAMPHPFHRMLLRRRNQSHLSTTRPRKLEVCMNLKEEQDEERAEMEEVQRDAMPLSDIQFAMHEEDVLGMEWKQYSNLDNQQQHRHHH